MADADAINAPVPLVAADLDLRSFPAMGLNVVRLRDSAFMAHSTPEQFRAGVLLWCAAWHQVPAGSLPSDERLLGRYAGYGGNSIGWRRVRAGAMHGFVLCADGRYYHPVVCEAATAAARKRRRQSGLNGASIDQQSGINTPINGAKKGGLKPDCSGNSPAISTMAGSKPVPKTTGIEGNRIEERKNPPTTHAVAPHGGEGAFDEEERVEKEANPNTSTESHAENQLARAEKTRLRLPPRVVEHIPPADQAADAAWVQLARDVCTAYRELAGRHPDDPPKTDHVWVWQNAGYTPKVCLAVIRDCLAHSAKARAASWLKWFDNPIAEAHKIAAAQPGAAQAGAGRTEAEQDAAWRRRVANFRADPNSWVAAYGPRPDRAGTKVPVAILVAEGFPLRPVLVHTADQPQQRRA